jgi:spermidine synthase
VEQKLSSTQQLVWFHSGPPRIEICEQGSFLCLYLDGILQSKMNQLAPAATLSGHLVPILCSLQQLKPESVLQLGLGGGDINRFITTTLPHTQLLTVEMNQAVIDAYQRFFCLKGKEELLALPAQDFLQNNQQQFPFVLWDIYPLFDGWQQAMQKTLQQTGTILINLSQPEYQQQLESLLTERSYQCHHIEGYLNLLYEINSLTEK